MSTRIKNAPYHFNRITVKWEYDYGAGQTDVRLRHHDHSIANWCIGNAERDVRVRRYTSDGFLISRNNISTLVDTHSADFLLSSYSYRSNSTMVSFLDLEFDDEDDLTLFLLVWVGRVEVVTAIPFLGQNAQRNYRVSGHAA